MRRTIIGTCGHIAQYDLTDFTGRVFVVSDLHGCYDLLHLALRDVGFTSETDLLFVIGDWTDRGPDSKFVLDYVNEKWVHSVQGNHEAMYIEAFESHWHPTNRSVLTLKAHGGDWIWNSRLTDLDKILIHDAFSAMPLGIELLLPGNIKIGLVHAEVPYNDWLKFLNTTEAELEWNDRATAQWSRTWYSKKHQGLVENVDLVMVGHTPTDSGKSEQYGNMMFIDGGSFFNDEINLVEIDAQFLERIICK